MPIESDHDQNARCSRSRSRAGLSSKLEHERGNAGLAPATGGGAITNGFAEQLGLTSHSSKILSVFKPCHSCGNTETPVAHALLALHVRGGALSIHLFHWIKARCSPQAVYAWQP